MTAWFSKIKNKLQFFSLGLMSGLVIGGGFFIFKLDDYFRELKAFKIALREQKLAEKENQTKEVEKAGREKKNKSLIKKNNDSRPETTALVRDSFKIYDRDLIEQNSMLKDTLITMIENDSATHTANPASTENVIVRKDELIASKIVEIQNFNLTANTPGKRDSLLQKISGIKEDVPKTSYKVEIWSSPLNYKGYKMTKNKIILYGVVNYETLRLYQLEEGIYIKTPVHTFKLEYSSEFKPLEKITDESILTRLK